MIDPIIRCRKCGKEYSRSHSDYIRGLWPLCPDCRDGPEDPPDETPDDASINNEKDNAS